MNLVYKTYEISTNIEYTSGTKLNLSGVRIIKLINRPSGVQVWISTDSNGTNLFPLINRGDGWELPNDYPPLYFLYIYTKGVNASDKLILSYTGEKNFFIFGSNSIEKVGEIESLGEQARLDVNNSIFNYYSRIPYTLDNKVFSKAFTGEILFKNIARITTQRYVCFPLSATGLVSELQLNDNEFYRFSIEGHIDGMSEASTFIGAASGTSGSVEVVHISLFNNTQGATFTPVTGQEIDNLYKLDKRAYTSKDKFDLYGLKSISQPNFFYSSGLPQVKIDITMLGKAVNKYQYMGIFLTFETWHTEHWRTNPSMHCSLIFTISKAISYVNITDELPTELNMPWINSNLVSLKKFSDDKTKADYVIERYKEVGQANKMMGDTSNIPKTRNLFDNLVNSVINNDADQATSRNLLTQYALTIYQYYMAWQRIEYLLPSITTESEIQRIETAKQTIVTSGSNTNNYTNDWYFAKNPVEMIEHLRDVAYVNVNVSGIK